MSAARHVPPGLYWRARLFEASAGLWRALARVETAVLRDELPEASEQKPIYVAGVARSGTTIMTEMLSRHPDVTSHRYSDFPNVYTPYWRNWLADRVGRRGGEAVERAHRDRLMVTPESPEAVEEVIWMQFFDRLHDSARSQVLDRGTANPAFERFYSEHIAKLLLVRRATRYLAKGNYNVTRFGYLLERFPEARFVVPVRNPINHVASLVKQDRLFQRLAGEDPRVPEHLHRSGHFEFGPGKRCIHAGDDEAAEAVTAHWSAGRLAQGWAVYWNSVYDHVHRSVAADPALRDAVLFVRYEDLCREPARIVSEVLEHVGLAEAPFESVKREYVDRLEEPDYYDPGFTAAERSAILEATVGAASRFGYAELASGER